MRKKERKRELIGIMPLMESWKLMVDSHVVERETETYGS